MTSQCFCMNSTPGRDGCIAMRCTQWPTSASWSGRPSDRRPRLTGRQVAPRVVAAEGARGRDRHEDPFRFGGIQDDRVQAHPARPWLPGVTGAVPAQAGQLLPVLAAVDRAEQRGVLDSGVDGVRIGERRLQVPDASELPRMRRAVVPLMSARDTVVAELVADRLPRPATVVGALDQLAEPAAGRRRVQPVRIGGRALQVIDFPAAEMRPVDIPLLALSVRCQDESALARAS